MDAEERKRVGARIVRARRERGLTQRELAELLGITTRSVQNYESGAIVPWRHLARIERITHKRAGWLLRDDEAGALDDALSELVDKMEQHRRLLEGQLEALRANTERLRVQRESHARERRRGLEESAPPGFDAADGAAPLEHEDVPLGEESLEP